MSSVFDRFRMLSGNIGLVIAAGALRRINDKFSSPHRAPENR